MKLPDFKELVQNMFPYPFDELLVSEEVDNIINTSIMFAKNKMEVIKSKTVSSSIDLPEASIIVKARPSYYNDAGSMRRSFNIFDMVSMSSESGSGVNFYFTPERKLLLPAVSGAVYIEYVVDPNFVTIEDFPPDYIEWASKYAVALISIKEGYSGTRAILSALPFEFNYSAMLENGRNDKEALEQKLEDMRYGCFSVRP